MNARSRPHSLVAAATLAAALAAPATAEPGPRQPVPFRASLSITETVAFTFAPPCFAIGALTGTGIASQLGSVRAVSTDCINPIGMFDPNVPMSFHFASTGTGLVIHAKGEQIFASYSGTLQAQPSGPHAVSGHFVITGGTGRYAGAVGGGTLSGYEDISGVVVGRGAVQFNGTISFP